MIGLDVPAMLAGDKPAREGPERGRVAGAWPARSDREGLIARAAPS